MTTPDSSDLAPNSRRGRAQSSSLPLEDFQQSGQVSAIGSQIDSFGPWESKHVVADETEEKVLHQPYPEGVQTERGSDSNLRTVTNFDDSRNNTFIDHRPPTSVQPNNVKKSNEAAELTNDLITKLQHSDLRCKALEKQVHELEKNLQDAHDFIFTLQPQRQIITPTEATIEFKVLCATVEDWIQTKLGDALDERRLRSPKDIVPEQAEKFMSLISSSGRDNFKVPDTDEYHVLAAIMNFLCGELFDKRFWCPVDRGIMEFLESIERSMESLEARRELAVIRSWRSETLIALTNDSKFASQSKAHIHILALTLTDMVRLFLPGDDRKEIYRSIKNSIIEPAASLAQKFQISVDGFSIEWSNLHRQRVKDWDLSRYECQNLLPPKRALKFPTAQQDCHIQFLFDICPGLQHREVKANAFDEPKMLKAPRILVAATKLTAKPHMVSREQFPTLLAWLEEVRPKRKLHSGRDYWN